MLSIPVSYRQWLLIVFGFLISVLLVYLLATVAQSLFVLAALERMGVEVPSTIRWNLVLHDIYGLAFAGRVSFAQAVLIGFAIAMPSAALLRNYLGITRFFVYPLAGAVALATILYIVKINFSDLTLFAGTRGTFGYLSQLAVGALGGGVFAVVLKKTIGN